MYKPPTSSLKHHLLKVVGHRNPPRSHQRIPPFFIFLGRSIEDYETKLRINVMAWVTPKLGVYNYFIG